MRKSQQKLFDQLTQKSRLERLALQSQLDEQALRESFESLSSVSRTILRVPLPKFGTNSGSHKSKTLSGYADELGIPTERLLEQFNSAGLRDLTPEHTLSEENKQFLLDHLRRKHSSSTSIYKDDTDVEQKLVVVQELSAELLARLSTEPALMHQLAPRKFEELVAHLLERQGCEVTLTKRTRDGGYDILGRKKCGLADLLFLAECKRYSPENKVGVEVIRGVYGVAELERANFGVVITSSTFTADARREALRIGPRMQLKEYQDLCAWLNSNGKSDV